MWKTISILFALINLSQQQAQDLCGETATFVADPAGCSFYLYCDREDPFLAWPLTCPQAGPFFLSDDAGSGVCQTDGAHCEAPLSLCPPVGTNDIMIADPLDEECRRHRLCRLPGMPWRSCPEPLRFNRNSGTCDLAERVVCNPPDRPPECPTPDASGAFPGNTCYAYFECFEGDVVAEFECTEGMKFDPTTGFCVPDPDNTCPRPPTRIRHVKVLRNEPKVTHKRFAFLGF